MKLLLLFLCVTMQGWGQTKPDIDMTPGATTFTTGTMFSSCDEGTKLVIPIRGGGEDVIAICHDNYYERVPAAQCPTGMICQPVPNLNVAAPAAQPAQTTTAQHCFVAGHGEVPCTSLRPVQKPAKPKVKCYSWPIDPTTAYCCDGTHHKIVPAKPAPKTLPLCKDMKVSGDCVLVAGQKYDLPAETQPEGTMKGDSNFVYTSAPSLSCAPNCSIRIVSHKRKNGMIRACYYVTTGEGQPCEDIKAIACPEGASCETLYDVTHELWLGGTKLGTITEGQ